MATKMIIECPAPACGHRYEDRDRASLIRALGADTGAVEVNRRQESTSTCPACGRPVEFGLLMLDDDGVWRISRFAGHAEDVTVMRPPGGGVSYDAPPREASEETDRLSPAQRTVRGRALAVIEGRTRNVAPSLQRDALELALDAALLDEAQAAAARQLLERPAR